MPGESSLTEAFNRSDRIGILTTVDSIVPVVRAMVQQSAPDRAGTDRIPIVLIGMTGPEIRGRPEEGARQVRSSGDQAAGGKYWRGVSRMHGVLLVWSKETVAGNVGLLHFVDPLTACAEAVIRNRKELSVAHE